MATTNVTATLIATMDAYPQGKLAWVAAEADVANTDTVITASAIIDALQGTGATGKILAVYDGGNAILQKTGVSTALSLCCLPSSGEGNITFRSAVDGTTNAQIKSTANIQFQCLIRF